MEIVITKIRNLLIEIEKSNHDMYGYYFNCILIGIGALIAMSVGIYQISYDWFDLKEGKLSEALKYQVYYVECPCGHDFITDEEYCTQCGIDSSKALITSYKYCKECDKKLSSTHKFCTTCGNEVIYLADKDITTLGELGYSSYKEFKHDVNNYIIYSNIVGDIIFTLFCFAIFIYTIYSYTCITMREKFATQLNDILLFCDKCNVRRKARIIGGTEKVHNE